MTTYRQRVPCRALRHLVKCYWLVESPASVPGAVETVVPDGCMEMIFHFGAPLSEAKAGLAPAVHPRAFVGGQIREAIDLHATGAIGMLGVRFHPYGAHPLLEVSMDEIAERTVDLTDLAGPRARALVERLREAGDHETRFALAEGFLLALLDHARDPDSLTRRAVGLLAAAEGGTSVRDVARALAVSERHLNRRLHRHVGLSAKSLARILRLQRALRAVRSGEAATLTDAASAAGYFDQAHFIKDFRAFCGTTPSRFLAGRRELLGMVD